jgi:tRNA U34 5-methylaminomethyl-2-thiouridine-forming methyltransferase MnmC
MRQIVTSDGSVTFRDEKTGDIYHSLTGAATESLEKFARPAGLGPLAVSGRIRILDICFGLGYNSAAALDMIHESSPACTVEIVGLENDPEILSHVEGVETGFKSYHLIRECVARLVDGSADLDMGTTRIKIMIGDARATVKTLQPSFDAVFLDPFSPKKDPALWQMDFLADVRKIMAPGARLTTYSCARMVRDNLRRAGFRVFDGPSIGRRSPATVAVNPRPAS